MTFDEWAENNWMYIDIKENARVIWDSATLAEREACEKVCLQVLEESNNIAASVCADRIRTRSNA